MKKQILIVEGERSRSQRLDDVLREAGYVVRAAGHKREAGTWLKAAECDLLLLDLDLSDESGFDVLDMAASYPMLRVVVLTAQLQDCESSALIGADAVIEKPIEPQLLLSTLEMLMDESAKDRLERRASGPGGIRFISSLRRSQNPSAHRLGQPQEQRYLSARI